MRLTRRSFFGRSAGVIVAAVGVPLFIPAERLDFGVPRALALPTHAELAPTSIEALARDVAAPAPLPTTDSVPMLLVHNEFLAEYGGRLEAGSTVIVDRATAGRWLDYGVAVPAEGYAVQPNTTRRALEAAQYRAENFGLTLRAEPGSTATSLYDLIVEARQKKAAASLDAATDALRAWVAEGMNRGVSLELT